MLRSEPLAKHTTFHVGGPADVALVESGTALERAANDGRLPDDIRLVLGGGSNVLVADGGVVGTVLVLRTSDLDVETQLQVDGDGVAWLDGAWGWSAAALGATRLGWQGLESMVGIPGTVGGALVQSIGAYGKELRDVAVGARAVDLVDGSVVELSVDDLALTYRNSVLKSERPRRRVVTSVGVRLVRDGLHEPRYAQLSERLEAASSRHDGGYPPLDVAQAVLDLRRSKSMVYDADDRQTWGAGSFFKNPECRPDELDGLLDRLAAARSEVPHWLIGGAVRVSAAWLVERAGFPRGTRRGDVALSDRHALAIVNTSGAARASGIARFAGEIREAVHRLSGLALEPEPVLVGLDLPPLPGEG